MSPIAVIPARAGSKRIPNKNIFPLLNKPAIAYAIQTAIRSELFSEVFVSTDSPEIASVAQSFGATVGNLRQPELSDDHATTIEVISGFIESTLQPLGYPDFICCIYPVTPLLTAQRLQEGFNLLLQYPSEFIFAALPTNSSPERNFRVDKDLKTIGEQESNLEARTQDLEQYFQDAGQFYWGSKESWLNRKSILGADCRAVKLKKYEVIDVDEIEDMNLIEALMRASQQKF
jgi:N-acylneuraminate cytidylyltransferase